MFPAPAPGAPTSLEARSGWSCDTQPRLWGRYWSETRQTPKQSSLFKKESKNKASRKSIFYNLLAHTISWVCQRKASGSSLPAVTQMRAVAPGSPLPGRKQVSKHTAVAALAPLCLLDPSWFISKLLPWD